MPPFFYRVCPGWRKRAISRFMCGIAALFAYGMGSAPVDLAELAQIRDSMAARGPDGQGLWQAPDGRTALAHRRLSIIELSDAGAQPMTAEDGRLAITFNGEIYNFLELRAELEAAGVRFRSRSDTEVLLRLYARLGPKMVERLRGMYAFALWDEARRGLFLARDPFGIKPLYYADDGKTFRLASQVKALVAGGRVGRGVNPAGHAGFLLFGSIPEPYTLYADIQALPAGATLWVDEKGAGKPDVLFRPGQAIADAESHASATLSRDGFDLLREAVKESVAQHLIADVPVGVFLSSGIDSTVLTGLAAERAGAQLQTLTLAFNEFRDTPKDESPLAEEVARHYGADHQTRLVAGSDFAKERERLLAAMDQPSVDGVNTYFVAKAARERGLKVALSGVGGDELFAGYDSFTQIPKATRLLAPFGCAPGLGRAVRRAAAPFAAALGRPKWAGLLELGSRPGDAYLLRRGLFLPWELPDILGAKLAQDGLEQLEPLLRLRRSTQGIRSARLGVHALEMEWYLKNQLLRDSDWAGMAHGLEIRTPLVDWVLFKKLLPLIVSAQPPAKSDLARTVQKPLPESVLHRPKTGFFIPVRQWLGGAEAGESSLRGWAKMLYRRFTGST